MGAGAIADRVAERPGAEAVDHDDLVEARPAPRRRGSGPGRASASSTRAPRRSSDEATVRARSSWMAVPALPRSARGAAPMA